MTRGGAALACEAHHDGATGPPRVIPLALAAEVPEVASLADRTRSYQSGSSSWWASSMTPWWGRPCAVLCRSPRGQRAIRTPRRAASRTTAPIWPSPTSRSAACRRLSFSVFDICTDCVPRAPPETSSTVESDCLMASATELAFSMLA